MRIWQSYASRTPEKLNDDYYYVARVIDGDSLILGNGARVRLLGVDAPETHFSPRGDGEDKPFALAAMRFTEVAVKGRKVRLQFDKERIDKYGRFLAYVWYVDHPSGEELLLNEELIRAGLAKALLKYSYSERMKRRFRAVEQEARGASRGIWSGARTKLDVSFRPLPTCRTHKCKVARSSSDSASSFNLKSAVFYRDAFRRRSIFVKSNACAPFSTPALTC
jgi:endonuclease YncB( thermonuclease family)